MGRQSPDVEELNMAKNDTKGKPVSEDAMPLHKAMAMGKPVETGAGKGALGGKSPSKKTPA